MPSSILTADSAVGIISADEQASLDWFVVRTAKKLPGTFVSGFWDTLIFQAVSNEQAVLHAVLALSSTHKRAAIDGEVLGVATAPDDQERFALRQYSKSIGHLQSHFLAKSDRASIRVILVACVVFIGVESLRGCYTRGCVHLCTGLNLLQEYLSSSNILIGDHPNLGRPRDSADDWIIEAFTRFYIQAKLLGQDLRGIGPIPHVLLTSQHSPTLFSSFREARLHLDYILSDAIYLTNKCRTKTLAEVNTSAMLLAHQRRLESQLAAWHDIFKALPIRSQSNTTFLDSWACRMLHLYYGMTYIMVETCLSSSWESVYDPYTKYFVSLLVQAIEVWESFRSGSTDELLGHQREAFRCTLDISWIPPLYYTALKCRVHRIRLHAIRLMDSISHRAGIWDARLATSAARKVLDIEEGDFYSKFRKEDDFSLGRAPEERDMTLPILPQSRRVHNVKVFLPDGPAGVLTLACTRKRRDGIQEDIMKEYDLVSRRWKD